MANHRKNLVFLQLALLIAILGIGAYATGYFWLGSRTDWTSTESGRLAVIERSYGSRWLARGTSLLLLQNQNVPLPAEFA
jgi:hypothetical protein